MGARWTPTGLSLFARSGPVAARKYEVFAPNSPSTISLCLYDPCAHAGGATFMYAVSPWKGVFHIILPRWVFGGSSLLLASPGGHGTLPVLSTTRSSRPMSTRHSVAME